uniref:Uncharacterized protein n=1 Tax=Anguilla anguilla TaxID=7936 RepID=A0A0E9PZX4_ANGAN
MLWFQINVKSVT